MSFLIVRATLVFVFLSFITGILILTATASTKGFPQVASDGVRRITPAELRDALKKGQAILIDVRNEESFKAGHIKGARLIPANEIASRVNELPKDKLIATYCS